jgi:thioredoxin-related protein
MRFRILTLLLFIASVSFGQTAKKYTNYEAALKMAKKQKKVLMVDVYTDWCYWCKQLDKITYKDSAVDAFMAKNFIFVAIDAEDGGQGTEIAKRFAVRSYPTILYINPSNYLISQTGGFMEPAAYIDEIDSVQRRFNKGLFYKGYSPKAPNMPEFYGHSFKKGSERKWPTDSTLNAYYASADLNSEAAFLIMSVYGLTREHSYVCLETLNKHREQFPLDNTNQIALNYVYKSINKAKDSSDFSLEHAQEIMTKYVIMSEEYKEYYALDLQMEYFSKFKNYVSYATAYATYVETHGLSNGSTANEYAWNIYENSDNAKALLIALQWMEQLTQETEEYNYEDTYASLLFAIGRYEEALDAANHAIEVGELAGNDVSATQELIQKIKSKI